MALQLTLSCDSDKIDTGPTLIHSTGVQDYKIPQDVIRVLQDNLTNDSLSDHEEGVLCRDGLQRIVDILRQNGFTLQNQTDDGQKAIWTVAQNGGDGNEQPVHPHNPGSGTTDENEADANANGEDHGGDDEGENKDGGEGGGEEQEEE